MKTLTNIFSQVLIVMLGLVLATCQKEEPLMPGSENANDIKSPRLKTAVYYEYYWNHLEYLTFESIKKLYDEGFLNKGNANALLVKYQAARQTLLKGNYDAAIGVLTAFVNLVDDFVEGGQLSPEQGDELVVVPEGIIESFSFQCGNTLKDVRDDQEYETVQIGGQCWLAENLNFEMADEGYPISYSYNNDPVNGKMYGSLYLINYDVITIACPVGWHMPSDDEWKTLEVYLGMDEDEADDEGYRVSGDVGRKLKSTSGWIFSGNGDNSSGFNALPAGTGHVKDGFSGMGGQSYFWSWTKTGSYFWTRGLSSEYQGVERFDVSSRVLFSIRCVKNE